MNKTGLILFFSFFISLINPAVAQKIIPAGEIKPLPFFGFKGDSVPSILLPHIVSTGSMETNGTFSPDGKEFFYSAEFLHVGSTIIHIKLEDDGKWSLPEIASFSGKYRDIDPIFSPDGNRVYFTSRRPLHDSLSLNNDTNLWYVERTRQGYGEPKQLGKEINTDQNQYYNSVSTNNTVFFHAKNEQDSNDIFKAGWKNGKYMVVPLDSAINSSSSEADPFISPNEDFIIFSSDRPGGMGGTDLYISFAKDSSWTRPQNLGAPINSIANDYAPIMNGKILIFTSGRFIEPWSDKDKVNYKALISKIHGPDNGLNNILWVNNDFLEKFRNKTSASSKK